MKHLEAGRKLGVLPSHRKALLRSLTLAIIEQDEIQTTPARAKELRWYAERIVTLAKRGDVAGRRRIVQLLGSSETQVGKPNRVRSAIEKVYKELVPRFQTRPGGYTQIFKLALNRVGDNAEQCIIRYIPVEADTKGKAKKASSKGESKKKAESSEKASPKMKTKTRVEKPETEAKAAPKDKSTAKTKKATKEQE